MSKITLLSVIISSTNKLKKIPINYFSNNYNKKTFSKLSINWNEFFLLEGCLINNNLEYFLPFWSCYKAFIVWTPKLAVLFLFHLYRLFLYYCCCFCLNILTIVCKFIGTIFFFALLLCIRKNNLPPIYLF